MQLSKKTQRSVFYNPKTLSLLSTLTNIYAWISLVLAILFLVIQFLTLDNQLISTYFLPSNYHWWQTYDNATSALVLDKLFSVLNSFANGISSFLIFKSISIGLNVLLELGFNMTSNEEETENE
jgi:hypothetical protein